jgi:transcriptional regulator with XRE-family HTH domain
MSNEQIKHVTQRELARLLGVSVQTVRNWRRFGWLTQPEQGGFELLFNLETVKADLLAHPQARVLPTIFEM